MCASVNAGGPVPTADNRSRGTSLGLLSLVDHFADPVTGLATSPGQRLAEVVAQGELAERAGFERFAVGEHHFSRYLVPDAHLLLAAVAARTRSIRLFTAVTLLPLHDPVRLAEQMGLVDQLSGGRLEVSVARGVSEAASAAFGVPGGDGVYDVMERHLTALLHHLGSGSAAPAPTPLLVGGPDGGAAGAAGNGRGRGGAEGATELTLVPGVVQRPHPPVWMGSGIHERSIDLAVRHRLPLVLPSLFRHHGDYLPLVERYRAGRSAQGEEHPPVAFPSYCWVAPTSREARRQWQPRLDHYVAYAKDYRGGFGRALDFATIVSPGGPGVCGSPAEVADKLGRINEQLGLSHHLLLMDVGGMPFPLVEAAVELLAAEVAPQLASAPSSGSQD